MAGQPDLLPNIKFDVTSQVVSATGLPTSNIVNPGNTIQIKTDVQISGVFPFPNMLAAGLITSGLKVTHHIENLHSGARIEQPGGTTFAVTPAGASVMSPPFALAVTPPPAGATETPYKVVTVVEAGPGLLQGIVAGFIDGPILMAVLP